MCWNWPNILKWEELISMLVWNRTESKIGLFITIREQLTFPVSDDTQITSKRDRTTELISYYSLTASVKLTLHPVGCLFSSRFLLVHSSSLLPHVFTQSGFGFLKIFYFLTAVSFSSNIIHVQEFIHWGENVFVSSCWCFMCCGVRLETIISRPLGSPGQFRSRNVFWCPSK